MKNFKLTDLNEHVLGCLHDMYKVQRVLYMSLKINTFCIKSKKIPKLY